MSSAGAASCAAVPVSDARAAASRRNGARSRGPKTPEGKARSAQNALKHGLRAQKHVLLPDEDAAEFGALEAALTRELAPVGMLQAVLARRVALAAWRLARADRIETELFQERHVPNGGLGLALIRDGNGTRSFETLLRYRGAALAEFWRALRTLKALQAEQAAELVELAAPAEPRRPALPCETDRRSAPNEPERHDDRRLEDLGSEAAASGRTLHEAPAPWTPTARRSGPRPPERTRCGPTSAPAPSLGSAAGPPGRCRAHRRNRPLPTRRARAAGGTRSLAGER